MSSGIDLMALCIVSPDTAYYHAYCMTYNYNGVRQYGHHHLLVVMKVCRRVTVAKKQLRLILNKENGVLSTGAVTKMAGVQRSDGVRMETRFTPIWKPAVAHNKNHRGLTEECLKERNYK